MTVKHEVAPADTLQNRSWRQVVSTYVEWDIGEDGLIQSRVDIVATFMIRFHWLPHLRADHILSLAVVDRVILAADLSDKLIVEIRIREVSEVHRLLRIMSEMIGSLLIDNLGSLSGKVSQRLRARATQGFFNILFIYWVKQAVNPRERVWVIRV